VQPCQIAGYVFFARHLATPASLDFRFARAFVKMAAFWHRRCQIFCTSK